MEEEKEEEEEEEGEGHFGPACAERADVNNSNGGQAGCCELHHSNAGSRGIGAGANLTSPPSLFFIDLFFIP